MMWRQHDELARAFPDGAVTTNLRNFLAGFCLLHRRELVVKLKHGHHPLDFGAWNFAVADVTADARIEAFHRVGVDVH